MVLAGADLKSRRQTITCLPTPNVPRQEEDNRALAASGVKKRGNPLVTVGAPVLVTSGFSFALLKFLNK